MDWKQLISELNGAGITQVRIAEECGCAQSTVSELLCGEIKNPSFPLGQALITLHRREVGADGTAE